MLDEIHEILRVAEGAAPFFEFEMLKLNLLHQERKYALDLGLQLYELGCFGVGIFVNFLFQITPLHLLTVLVEDGALVQVLAQKTRLLTILVYADLLAGLAVDALGLDHDQFDHQ